jgi:hypothetical protein
VKLKVAEDAMRDEGGRMEIGVEVGREGGRERGKGRGREGGRRLSVL